MKRKVFLYNQVSKPTSILSTQIKTINVDNKTMIIYNIDRIPNLSYGMMFTISNTPYQYTIERVVYNEPQKQYEISFNGLYDIISNEQRTIVFYNVNETAIRESYEIDIEQYQLEIILQISNLTDPTSRPDNLSKQIVLPDTERNRQALGNPESFNKQIDITQDERLNQNYAPIRPVDLKVFDDGYMVFEGLFYLYDIEFTNGNWSYIGFAQGFLNDFKSKLQDKMLSDIDLIDLQHSYQMSNIINSWGGYNPGGNYSIGTGNDILANNWVNNNQPILVSVEIGKNYVYPFIEYGEQTTYLEKSFKVFNSAGTMIEDEKTNMNPNQDWRNVKLQNFRPALYVTEVLNRIFKEIKMSYKIVNNIDPNFEENFKKLIIPNNQEKFTSAKFGIVGQFQKPIPQLFDSFGGFGTVTIGARQSDNTKVLMFAMKYPNSNNQDFVRNGNYVYANQTVSNNLKNNQRLVMLRSMTTDIRVNLAWSIQDQVATGMNAAQGNANKPKSYIVQVLKRSRTDAVNGIKSTNNYTNTDGNDGEMDSWQSIYERTYANILNSTQNHTNNIVIPNAELEQGDELIVVFKFILDATLTTIQTLPRVQVTNNQITFGSLTKQTIFEPKNGDPVRPSLPTDVSQVEFLKNLMNVFNLMIYIDPLEDIVYLEPYDSFYQRFQPSNLRQFALDWTRKVDYSSPLKVLTNNSISKKYNFTFAEDGDFYNSQYKNTFNEVYSSRIFIDSLGITEEKKIETGFSPSPTITIPGTDRYFTMISSGGSNYDRKRIKSKIRLMFFNGVFACSPYDVLDDTIIYTAMKGNEIATVNWFRERQNLNWYPLTSNYLALPATNIFNLPYGLTLDKPALFIPIDDIHFFPPKEFFFDVYTTLFLNLDGSYRHYRNQITQLTNPQMRTAEVYVNLSQDEVANFDLKTPIYIDFKEGGSGYFRVINLVWNADNPMAIATLQQVNQK